MIVHNFLSFYGFRFLVNDNFNNVVNHDEASDYKALSNFEAVNTGVDIDSICTKDCDVAHVEVVQKAQVQELAA